MAELEFIGGHRSGDRVVVAPPRFVVGRQFGCDLKIDDAWASREHFALNVRHDGSCELEDLQSENGTWIGADRIDRRYLRDGEVLRVGTTRLRFHIEGSDPSTEDLVFDDKTLRQELQQRIRRIRDLERELRAAQEEIRMLQVALKRRSRLDIEASRSQPSNPESKE